MTRGHCVRDWHLKLAGCALLACTSHPLTNAAVDAMDKDGGGTVTATEFTQAMKRLGLGLSDEQCAAMVSTLDQDGNGEIAYSEFIDRLWRHIEEKQAAEPEEEQLSALQMQSREAEAASKTVELTEADKAKQERMLAAQTQNAMRVLRQTIQGVSKPAGVGPDGEQLPPKVFHRSLRGIRIDSVAALFIACDKDSSGLVDVAELRTAFGSRGLDLGLTEKQLDEIVAAIDGSGDLELNYQELVAAIGLEEKSEAYAAAAAAVEAETKRRQEEKLQHEAQQADLERHTQKELQAKAARKSEAQLENVMRVLRQAIGSGRTLYGKNIKTPEALFKAIDRDNSQTVSKEELTKALTQLGFRGGTGIRYKVHVACDISADSDMESEVVGKLDIGAEVIVAKVVDVIGQIGSAQTLRSASLGMKAKRLKLECGWVSEHNKSGKMQLEKLGSSGDIGIDAIVAALDTSGDGLIDFEDFVQKSKDSAAKENAMRARLGKDKGASPRSPIAAAAAAARKLATTRRRAGGGWHVSAVQGGTKWTRMLKSKPTIGRQMYCGHGPPGTFTSGSSGALSVNIAAGSYIPTGFDTTPPKIQTAEHHPGDTVTPAQQQEEEDYSQYNAMHAHDLDVKVITRRFPGGYMQTKTVVVSPVQHPTETQRPRLSFEEQIAIRKKRMKDARPHLACKRTKVSSPSLMRKRNAAATQARCAGLAALGSSNGGNRAAQIGVSAAEYEAALAKKPAKPNNWGRHLQGYKMSFLQNRSASTTDQPYAKISASLPSEAQKKPPTELGAPTEEGTKSGLSSSSAGVTTRAGEAEEEQHRHRQAQELQEQAAVRRRGIFLQRQVRTALRERHLGVVSAFTAFDADEDGLTTPAEISQGLQAMGIKLPVESSGKRPSLQSVLQQSLQPIVRLRAGVDADTAVAVDGAHSTEDSVKINFEALRAWLAPEPAELAAAYSRKMLQKPESQIEQRWLTTSGS